MKTPFLIKLQSFRTLEPGWSYGEGGPIPNKIVNDAEQLLTGIVSTGLGEIDVFPGLDGEVMISVYDGTNYLELMLEPDDTVTFTHEVNGDEVNYLEGLSTGEALAQVNNYKEKAKICAISECYTRTIMIQRAEDSLVQHLSHLAGAAASQFSPWSVLSTLVTRSANTSSTSMQESLDLRLCTGSSNRILFQATAV